jgi:tetratricopeptide (TPR) repeat protein
MNLTIYRGEARISQVPLTGKTIRLGRGKDNDVVLEDPGKGVSRNHAELRPEGKGYRLVDLESQNGIWVSGEKVPTVLLAPGVVAVMGPFRVAINAASPLTQPFSPITGDMLSETRTEFSRPIPPPSPAAPVAVAVAVDGPGALLDDPGPVTGEPATPPAPRPSAGATPTKPSSVVPAAPRPPRPAGAVWYNQPGIWVIVAVVLIAASGFGAYKLVHKALRKPVWDATAAMTLANNGRCQEALDQQINPALQVDPNNADALSLKQKCTAPPPTTTVLPTVVPEVPTPKTNAQKLDEAEGALAANQCQAALDTANLVLTDDPNDDRAKGLVTKANACLNPVTTPTRATTTVGVDPVVKIAPADGGLEPSPGESGKDYKARVNAMRKRYDDAVALLQGQRNSQALREFDAIGAAGVPQGYRELAQRRGEARSGLKDEANRNYTQGLLAEQRSDWNAAIDRFQRAHELDPARDISPDLARINEQKLKLGRQLCNDGLASFSLAKNADAAEKLTKAIELLPSSEPCYVKAKEALVRIGR